MSEAKRPRLEGPQLNIASRSCFVRHFSQCYQKTPKSLRVLKENLLKATLINRASIFAVRSIFRGFWLENKIGWEFELQLDNGKGPRLRFSDSITFSILSLINPRDFRICGHFGDYGNYSRIDQLISLSKNSKELVAYKPTHEDNFLLLLQSMGQHLNYLECDPKFLTLSEVPFLKIQHFKSSPARGQVPLRDLLWHKIKCLDLSNDKSGACIADEECPTQNALETLIVRGYINSTGDVLNYLLDVKVFAPNLRSYEVVLDEEIQLDEIKIVACKFSDVIWSKYLSLDDFADKCKGQIETLKIFATIGAEIPNNIAHESDWKEKLQQLSGNNFKTTIENDSFMRNELIELRKNENFLKLDFKVKLSVRIEPEWDSQNIFQRLNT